MDNENNCNVGYAFINLKTTKHVLKFFKEFNDKKWEKFNSDKICQIAYARI